MGRRLRRGALVALMVLAAVVAPVALPIRMVVLHLRRETKRTEFVLREERTSPIRLPQTI
jgi:hypothetical protein